eukprot:6141055-Pyramimonas_sp.AAC.1
MAPKPKANQCVAVSPFSLPMAIRGPKMVPRGPKRGPLWPQDGPKSAQERSKNVPNGVQELILEAPEGGR